MRRLGVLMGVTETDPLAGPNRSIKEKASRAGLDRGQQFALDVLWGGSDVDRIRAKAMEIVRLQPDVIVAHTILPSLALQKETNSIPIVFGVVSNPDGASLVGSIPRPGGNITGYTNMEPTMGAKWLQTLKEIAPNVKRIAIMNRQQSGHS